MASKGKGKPPPRGPGGGQRMLRVRVKTAAKRSPSSARWLERQLNDPYVAASKREGFRSRAAYKLIEIDDKFRILKSGQRVVDLGAAPGGWSQVAADRVQAIGGRGQVVAIDVLGMEPLAGVEIIELDFTDPRAEEKLKSLLRDRAADVVLSDMAAPTVGHAKTDHLRIMGLAEAAADFACDVLTPGGVFVCKVLQGGTEKDLLDRLKKAFAQVRHVKPPASRINSAELYVVATGFRGNDGARKK
jgi:23S rRNA (uridine2552-2'-O)-methyltransferase